MDSRPAGQPGQLVPLDPPKNISMGVLSLQKDPRNIMAETKEQGGMWYTPWRV